MKLRAHLIGVVALCCAASPTLAGPVNNTTQATTYDTIQAAIDQAIDGDVIVADPGTYVENVDFQGKAITVRSFSGDPGDTIIDGHHAGPVVSGTSNKTALTMLSGFTLTNGYAVLGAGINTSNGNPFVTNCVVRANTGTAGAGAYVASGTPTFSECRFADNTAVYGGGMFVWGGVPLLVNCEFTGNAADVGGAIDTEAGGTTLVGCALSANTATIAGGGISAWGGATSLTSCALSANTAGVAGGGLYLSDAYTTTITNCILWNNTPDQLHKESGLPVVSYCDVQGGVPLGFLDAGANIDADPLFANAPDADLRLTAGSPCIDAGNNDAPDLAGLAADLAGNPRFVDDPATPDTGAGTAPIIDMGPYEFQAVLPPMPVHNITQGIGYSSIQSAIGAAFDGDVIEADPGTYFENINFLGRAVVVRSASDDPNDTIIDGRMFGPVVTFDHGEGQATVLQAFTLIHGEADNGGGIFVTSSSSPTIARCILEHNEAFFRGGGMFNDAGCDSFVTGCIFMDNTAAMGGAMSNLSSDPTVFACEFDSNTSTDPGIGGGAMFNDAGSRAQLAQCTFSDNSSANGGPGGAMYNRDSGPMAQDCMFIRNEADFGGGGAVFSDGGTPTFARCAFLWGAASNYGGGLAFEGGGPWVVTDCLFAGNSAALGGGALSASGSTTLVNCALTGNNGGTGGAIYFDGGTSSITNCTLSLNTGNNGGGIYNAFANLVITNCVLWGNSPDQFSSIGFGPSSFFERCDIEGGVPPGQTDAGGNILDDPLFVDADGPDGMPGTNDDDLRLMPGSPCIDAGASNAPDLAGVMQDLDANPRFVDDPATPDTGVGPAPIVDMGCYEFQATIPAKRVRNITQGTDYNSIQLAINDAFDGDVIEADPGAYLERINFHGKAITVRSASGDPTNTTIDGMGIDTVVTFGSGEGPGSVLSGFTIQNGTTSQGGGLLVFATSPTIVNCIFSHNTAASQGGGAYLDGGAPTFTGCSFLDNTAVQGGAVFISGGTPSFTGCRLQDNVATDPLSGGGAIFDSNTDSTITSCEFLRNFSTTNGGAIHSDNSRSLITSCTFLGNTSSIQGAAVRADNGQLTFLNCLFSGNTLFGIASEGGAYYCESGKSIMVNCTFSGNVAVTGGGLYGSTADLSIDNCILWGNTPDQFATSTLFLVGVSYSDVEGGVPGGTPTLGGNISTDPLFFDADGPDNTPGTPDDDLHIRPGSPCIDAGNNTIPELTGVTTDLDNNARLLDDPGTPDTGLGIPPIIDMGPYEFQGVSPIQCACVGDIDGDCDTDVNDFAVLARGLGADRGARAFVPTADLNGDGTIDVFDFGVFVTNFGCRN